MLDLPGVEEEDPDGPRRGGGVVPAGLEPGGLRQYAQLLARPTRREGGEVPRAPLSLLSLPRVLHFTP